MSSPHVDPQEQHTPTEEKAPLENTKRPLRFTTIVWGLLLTIIGLGTFAIIAGYHIDTELVAIGTLGVSGLVLLTSALVRAVKKK
ncbi:hypothetical protein [Timonella sp. A28]|uniref:hypothetical protein n=1 Tax=Timonella sp. A28 TaxID=3442640 RepID=UPI003EB7CF7F